MDSSPPHASGPHAVIDIVTHPLAVTIRSLLTRAGRSAAGEILIDDEDNIAQAISGGVRLVALFHSGDATLSPALREAAGARIPVHEVAKRTCKKLFETERMSRVFAIATAPARPGLLAFADMPKDIVILDDLSLSGNIGAIIRTSVALGVGGIVVVDTDEVDLFDRRLIRASRGLVFRLPIATASADDVVAFCSRSQRPIVVTTPRSGEPVAQLADRPGPLAIVFGGEKRGGSTVLQDAAALAVTIPTTPLVESLNVSAAAGITLFNRVHVNQAV
jgi:TrmH family RNA methyltransferase